MSDTPGIVITGASGRMGQMLIGQVSASDRVHLAGAVERAGHAWVGQDIGVAMGGTAVGVIVTDNAAEAMQDAQAVIDFTAPEATLAFAKIARMVRTLKGKRSTEDVVRRVYKRFSAKKGRVSYNYRRCGRKPWKVTKEFGAFLVRRLMQLRRKTACTSATLQAELYREKHEPDGDIPAYLSPWME